MGKCAQWLKRAQLGPVVGAMEDRVHHSMMRPSPAGFSNTRRLFREAKPATGVRYADTQEASLWELCRVQRQDRPDPLKWPLRSE